jgi:uncharacterized membrane protein
MQNYLPSFHAWSVPEKVFTYLFTIFGIITIIIVPPFGGADEEAHFYRAYQLSQLDLVGTKVKDVSGGVLPSSIGKVFNSVDGSSFWHPSRPVSFGAVWDSFSIPLHPGETEMCWFPNTVLYSPVPYIAQASTIGLLRLFDVRPTLILYFCRVANFLLSGILLFWAIRLTPIAKWTFVIVPLLPLPIFQIATTSNDSFTIASCFLFTALAFRMAFTDAPLTRRMKALVLFLALLVALSKQAYAPLALLFLLIPQTKAKNSADYCKTFCLLLAVCAVAVGSWSAVVSSIYTPIIPTLTLSPKDQISNIIHHPLTFTKRAALSYVEDFHAWFPETFVGPQSPVIRFPFVWNRGFAWLLFAAVCGVSAFGGSGNVTVSGRQRALVGLTLALSMLGVAALCYIAWNPVGALSISGIQWRYFIPLVPANSLLIYGSRRSLDGVPRLAGWMVGLVATAGFIDHIVVFVARWKS